MKLSGPSGKQPRHQFIGGRWPSILAGTRQRLRRDRLGEPERSVSGERLSQEAEAAAPVFRSPSPSVGSDGRRQGRKGSEGQRTALISAFFSSDQQAVRLTRRPEATRSRPDEPERGYKLKLSGPSGKHPHHQFIGGRWPSILAGTRQRLRRDRRGEPERSVSGERLSQEAEAAGPVFRLSYERRLSRSATGSRRVGGSADRADLRFLQFRSAGGPADPETRSVPKPSGGAGARI